MPRRGHVLWWAAALASAALVLYGVFGAAGTAASASALALGGTLGVMLALGALNDTPPEARWQRLAFRLQLAAASVLVALSLLLLAPSA